jgi:hypothetical protein
MPGRPNRQLTKRELVAFDLKLLNAIEAMANSAPNLGNEVFRNNLILDNELRTSTALTYFFIDGEVAELQQGFNLLRDERAWERVSNTVFFNAIRMAWNNFSQRTIPDQGGSSLAGATLRNADVVWLENWFPTAIINPENRLDMPFLLAEVLDIRARARMLQ